MTEVFQYSPEKEEFGEQTALENGKVLRFAKVVLEDIPEPSQVVGLVSVNGEMLVAQIPENHNKFKIGEDVYRLEDGRTAKLEIPDSKGIEVTD